MWVQIVAIATFVVPGILIGYFASKMTKRGNIGTLFNMIIGVAGAAAGYYILSFLGLLLFGVFIGNIINSSIGAIALLVILKLIKK